jgi:LemA protein
VDRRENRQVRAPGAALWRGYGVHMTHIGRLAHASLFVVALGAMSGCGYNGLVAADENVKASWAQVENAYQRRADLVPNLVATVKGSAQHEEKVLAEITTARASATQVKIEAKDLTDPAKMKEFEDAQAKLSGALGRLIATSENYPDLKANASFRDLQTQLEGTENRISVERRRYNESVEAYNVQVRSFPTVVVAKTFGFKAKEPFHATAANADKAPEVKF